jgi:hypothetical protein
MHRAHLSAEERRWRARLAQLVSERGLIRGTLTVRERVCGRPNCRCARGEKHASLYLTSKHHGQPRQLYIPREREAEAREWVENFRRVRQLLEQISELYWERLKGG